MDSDDGHTTISMYLMPFNCALKNGKFYIYFFKEGNGNPLQYSCLENPMEGGAW